MKYWSQATGHRVRVNNITPDGRQSKTLLTIDERGPKSLETVFRHSDLNIIRWQTGETVNEHVAIRNGMTKHP